MNSVHSDEGAPVQEARVVDEKTWLEERRALLSAEKDLLRAYDAMIAQRRKLPWQAINKDYTFETVDGKDIKLSELVPDNKDGSNRALILQHFMYPLGWDKACSSCSLWTDTISGFLPQLNDKADFVAIINAPSAEDFRKFLAIKKWPCRLLRAKNYEFGQDFGVSQTEEDAKAGKPVVYNFKEGPNPFGGLTELPGFSVFAKTKEGQLCRTYGAFARGMESYCSLWAILDMTPTGRQGWHPRHREEYLKDAHKDGPQAPPQQN